MRDTKEEAWRAILEKQKFNFGAEDKHVELLNFKLDITNISEIRAYEISDEGKVLIIKKWLGQQGLLLIKKHSHKKEKRNIKPQRDCFQF